MNHVEQIKRLMKVSYHYGRSIEGFCEEVGSYHSLRKQFRKSEGITLLEYRQNLLLTEAKKLLADDEKMIF